MPNGKNLTANAQGAPTSRVRSAKKSVSASTIIPHYRVKLRTIGKWADDYKCGSLLVFSIHAYSAEEALGMAILEARKEVPGHAVFIDKDNCTITLLNPAALNPKAL